jgi:hypothetical protein
MRSAAVTIFAMVTLGCTYGPAEDLVAVQNVALRSDGRVLAAIVKYERSRPPTGVAAFPDGGVPRILEQRADLYVFDLETNAMLFQGSMAAPPNRRVSFSPWLIGWANDRVYFQITGCSGSPGSDCHGPLVGTSLLTLAEDGTIVASAAPASITLQSSVIDATKFVAVGTESYGVSVRYERGAPRSPVLRFAGERLEPIQP